ncbi:cytochrome c oxidase assembly protein [Cellulosimicrobium cellulans]|uniref:cytochrome c oxidase assembly protein n=1 Tax=Cellulosimicrobium cellulans TaxID=1710 RepID=UPI001966BB78|nr:cytochrome c oxidase assembly protein [Cellulosimicrobium cellulans]MBN0039682.1 cytochrome c oxidase assembly protein [Cellulosimicrobium cellulans]
MHPHDHVPAAGPPLLTVVAVVALAVGAAAYAVGLRAARARSPWPARRTLCWYAGLACAGAATLGPLAEASRASFTAHMAGHVLLGMLAPLLLVLAAPVSLLLRALPAARARRVSAALRSPVAHVVGHPVVAALLDGGGLWLLYTTGLFHVAHGSAPVDVVVHAHVLLAGWLLTASLVGPDPHPSRASFRVRATVLVAFVAAHSVLAKWLYAHPPAGVSPADARAGAQLMYYAGDAVDVALMVLMVAGWYTASRPRDLATARVREHPGLA